MFSWNLVGDNFHDVKSNGKAIFLKETNKSGIFEYLCGNLDTNTSAKVEVNKIRQKIHH